MRRSPSRRKWQHHLGGQTHQLPLSNTTFTIVVGALNDNAPVITSDGGGPTANINAAENQTAVTTVVAADADASSTITYSIIGGADAAHFAINSSSGVLTFVSPPDYETPTDDDLANTYVVVVQASDGTNTDTQAITVTVTDVSEGGGGSAGLLFNVASNSQYIGQVV